MLRNEIEKRGNWLLVKLEGQGDNTAAIGAEVTVRRVRGNGEIKWKGALVYVSETLKGEPIGLVQQDIRSGTSYLSQDDMRQHFGLGKATRADSVEVRWPDGTISKQNNVRAGRLLVVSQVEPKK